MTTELLPEVPCPEPSCPGVFGLFSFVGSSAVVAPLLLEPPPELAPPKLAPPELAPAELASPELPPPLDAAVGVAEAEGVLALETPIEFVAVTVKV